MAYHWKAALVAAALCLCSALPQDALGVAGGSRARITMSDDLLLQQQLAKEPPLFLDQELDGRQLFGDSSGSGSSGSSSGGSSSSGSSSSASRGYSPRSPQPLSKLRGDLLGLHDALRGNATAARHAALALANQLRERAPGESEFSGDNARQHRQQQRPSNANDSPWPAADSAEGDAAVPVHMAAVQSSPRLRGGIGSNGVGARGAGAAVAHNAAELTLTAAAVPYGDACCFDYPKLDPPSHPRHRPGLCYVSDKFKFVYLLVRCTCAEPGWVVATTSLPRPKS